MINVPISNFRIEGTTYLYKHTSFLDGCHVFKLNMRLNSCTCNIDLQVYIFEQSRAVKNENDFIIRCLLRTVYDIGWAFYKAPKVCPSQGKTLS